MVLNPFEIMMHTCTKCKDLEVGTAIQYYPIISFGDPENKPVIVVGINPSTREYEKNYVSKSQSIEERHQSQMNYFKKKPYTFFKHVMKYFQNPVRDKLGWKRIPWEKVGYLDIVKCPVRMHPHASSQWSSLSKSQRKEIINNCSPYLFMQLERLQPNLVMAYGADVCRWFYSDYSSDDAFTVKNCNMFNRINVKVVFVPQTRGSHPQHIIDTVKARISENL